MVRDYAEAFSIPLTIIMQSSLIHAIFPQVWRHTKIIPIPKAGSLSDVTLSRPIAILCAFSKVLEMHIYELVFNQFKPVVSPLQHGFLPKRSTITNLAVFTQIAKETLCAGEQLDVFCADFAKAFDKVDSEILIQRLTKLGLTTHLIHLLLTYLVDRKNFVYYLGRQSKPYVSTSGVPQGSNLGPLLFLIFINDLAQYISCFFDLYADDLKFDMKVCSIEDSRFLQSNIDCLAMWCAENKLQLNFLFFSWVC